MKIKRIVQHFSTRPTAAGTIHWGFRITRTSDGKSVAGRILNNGMTLAAALTNRAKNYDAFSTYQTISAKELYTMPFAGSRVEEIREWIKKQFKKKQ
jgi:hypothetical protein